jgi:CheY-like chemotaxis protein
VRILVIDERKNERDAILKALPKSTYEVEAVADERTALESMGRLPTEVVIFASPVKGGDELVRKIRNKDASAQVYLLAIVDSTPTQKELSALLAAGVNDFLRRPLVDAEILERTKAPARLLRWARSVHKPTAFDFTSAPDIAQLRAWQRLGNVVGDDLAQMAGQAFTVKEGFPKRFSGEMTCATIPMSLAGDQLELRLSVAFDRESLGWVRSALLGDASAPNEAVNDALRELANTAGGALKRSATDESVTLTTGLPLNETFTLPETCSAWTLEIEGTSAVIAVVGQIRSKANQRVAVEKLCEGMVIAHDVRTEAGILLVPGGSRLTSTTAAKLAKILAPRSFLEVAPAA